MNAHDEALHNKHIKNTKEFFSPQIWLCAEHFKNLNICNQCVFLYF
jgi:hypothetical protein